MQPLPEFFGGSDTQRSTNLSDDRMINLYQTTNDKGDIGALVATPVLTVYGYTPNGLIPTGIYTASNGRCFTVAGTVLYEITAGGVFTSRGTVTAGTVTRMVDNGIEMCIVNGIGGWIFTFATNTLTALSVNSADFTVTIANPAVFTKVAHGLVAGDALRFTSTTGTILSDTVLSVYSPSTVTGGANMRAIASSPNGQFVYAAPYGDLTKEIFFYIKSGGKLTQIGYLTQPHTTWATAYQDMCMSSDGISLYACGYVTSAGTYTPGLAHCSANLTTGVLTYVNQYSSGSALATPKHATSITLSPNDDFLYFISEQNLIHQFSRNVGTGALAALGTPTVATGNNPKCIKVTTDGLFAYVTNKTDNNIKIYSRDIVTGLLTLSATTACSGLSPEGLDLSKDASNSYVYVVNSGSNFVEVYSRNAGTGALTLLGTSATETNPQKISVTLESAYVTNAGSNTVSMFVRSQTTGLLSPASTASEATGATPTNISIAPDGTSVYIINSGSNSISQYGRTGTASNVGLPTGLAELTDYYVIATGLTADNFQVSTSLGGAAVSTSGQQAGVHTYTTLSYGFPNGANNVSYMNGRFIAEEPNTQNFYVSDVLKGKVWQAINVQTVDSNPDYVKSHIVSHNELIVLGEQSGEVYYDSGTYPTPFVRNSSGVFEVGCIAPYSVAKIDNSVMWLGKSSTGQGVIYRLEGYTPVRKSTYSIEYAIQQMSSISDAVAFTYQQEGHHFYVITFPTGNKTFVYDANTQLWHERATWTGSLYNRWEVAHYSFFDGKHLACDVAEGKIYELDINANLDGVLARKWTRSFRAPSSGMERVRHNKLALEAEVGVGTEAIAGTGVVSSISMANNGQVPISYSLIGVDRAIPNFSVYDIAWNGSVFVAVGSTTAGDTCYTSPDGTTWTARTTIVGDWKAVSWNGAVFCAIGLTLAGAATNIAMTSPDGITWTSRTLPTTSAWKDIEYHQSSALFVAFGYNAGTQIITSPDGITWTSRTPPAASASTIFKLSSNGTRIVVVSPNFNQLWYSLDGITWSIGTGVTNGASSITWNGSIFCSAMEGTTQGGTSPDGITWTSRTLPAAYWWSGISAIGSTFFLINWSNNNGYMSTDGITWTLQGISGTVGTYKAIANDGTKFVAMAWSIGSIAPVATGNGYYTGGTYALTFTGGGGTGAAGTYTISSTTGQITSVNITNGGSGYGLTPPSVSFLFGGISGALGYANLTLQYQTPNISMRYSNDGGHTWSTPRDISLGTLGQYSKRVKWERLGMTTGQPRIYEISGTAPVKTVLLGAYLE